MMTLALDNILYNVLVSFNILNVPIVQSSGSISVHYFSLTAKRKTNMSNGWSCVPCYQ